MLLAPRATHRPGATISAAVAVILLAAPASASTRSAHHRAGHATKKAARAPKVTPNQEGKVAAFPVRYDDENGFSAQIVRILQAHGLEVSTDTRRVDTSEQFRELSTALGFAAYVDGQYDEGPVRSKLTIQVRNGWTGRKVAAVTFRETKLHLRTEVEEKLWTKIGPAIAHACTDASKPRKRDRDPMMIEAGTPLADK